MAYTAEQLHTSFDALLASEYGDKFERVAEFDTKQGEYIVSTKPEVETISVYGSEMRKGKNLPTVKLTMTPDDDFDEVFGPKK